MIKALLKHVLIITCFLPSLVLSEDESELISRDNFEATLIHEVPPLVYFIQGSDLITLDKKNLIVNEVIIQYVKLGVILGEESLSNFASSQAVFNIKIISQEELDKIAVVPGVSALTINGVICLTPENLDPSVIRHEILHAIVYANVRNKLPWWIEEGLAQVLSGEVESTQVKKSKTNIERKYQQARQRVHDLVNRCGFKSLGKYMSLISSGNTERYSYSKVFNQLCMQKSK